MLLDESQKIAIETAVKQRLTMIQGPPGTGKTHTAVHLNEALIEMGRGPILACANLTLQLTIYWKVCLNWALRQLDLEDL